MRLCPIESQYEGAGYMRKEQIQIMNKRQWICEYKSSIYISRVESKWIELNWIEQRWTDSFNLRGKKNPGSKPLRVGCVYHGNWRPHSKYVSST